jgi:putative ABC transport system substrate-binding protein
MKKIIIFLMAIIFSMSFMTTFGCFKADFTVGIVQIADHVALDASNKGFRDELTALLKEEGKTVRFINKSAAGDISICTDIANNYVAKRVDLMLAIATPAAQAAAATTEEIPILFTAVTDPEVADLVESWDKPNTNLSGTSDLNPVEDQIALLEEIVTGNGGTLDKIAVFYTTSEANSVFQVDIVEEYCAENNIEVVKKGITDTNALSDSYNSLTNDVDGIYIPTDNGLAAAAEYMHTLNKSGKKLPVVCGENGMNDKCGVATYGLDYYELGKQTARMAYRILMENEDIKDMPVEMADPDTIKLTVNYTVAEELDLDIPESILARLEEEE